MTKGEYQMVSRWKVVVVFVIFGFLVAAAVAAVVVYFWLGAITF